MSKTIFSNPKGKKFVAIKSIPLFDKAVIKTAKIKSRIPDGVDLWFSDEKDPYFLGVISDKKTIAWQEAKALVDYLLDVQPAIYEILVSDIIKTSDDLHDFISECIELEYTKSNEIQMFYVRNVEPFDLSKSEENIHLITVGIDEWKIYFNSSRSRKRNKKFY